VPKPFLYSLQFFLMLFKKEFILVFIGQLIATQVLDGKRCQLFCKM